MLSNKELKLLLESDIPDNIKNNHELFFSIFNIFFEYISDAYIIGSDVSLIMESDEKKWDSKYSTLYHTDLKEIKKELIKTYLYDYDKFIDSMSNNPEIYEYYSNVYNKTVDGTPFDISYLLNKIDSNDFLNHKKISQQKTIPILFNYLMYFVNKMQVPNIHGTESFLEMYQGTPSNPKKPFSYTVNSSLPRTVYDNAISPRIHPVGFSNEYKYESHWNMEDYVNLKVSYEDWKVYIIASESKPTFYSYTEKSKKVPHCTLSYSGDELVSQFDVDYKNTLSLYGKNITEATALGDGNSLIKISENEYKLYNDMPITYDTSFNGSKLVDGTSNKLYVESEFYEDNTLTGNGGMITSDGSILIDGEKIDGYKVENNYVFVLKNKGTEDEKWEIDSTYTITDGFIFKENTKTLFANQGLKFDERSDFIVVSDDKSDSPLFSTMGSHSFFITLDDVSDQKYIFSTNDRSSAIKHSLSITADRVVVYERGGKILEAFYTFTKNKEYHIVFQWDSSGRRIFVDGAELFITDKGKIYPEKLYYKTLKTDWIVDDTLNVTFNFKTYSVQYDRAYQYDNIRVVPLKVNFFKTGLVLKNNERVLSNYVLLETVSDIKIIEDILNTLNDNKYNISQQKQLILKEYDKRSLDMTEVEKSIEMTRINEMFSQINRYTAAMFDFEVTFDNETIKFSDLIINDSESRICTFFDNILNENLEVFNEYQVEIDTSNFLYSPEVNNIIIGNTIFHYNEGINKTGYILENYDIFSRPLTKPEIMNIFTDHDRWVNEDIPEDLIVRWSLDAAIWENYHSELEFSRPSLWNIGDTYTIGMKNLLIKYYIANNSLGAVLNCSIEKYIDHPKALIDYNILYNEETVLLDNVVDVAEGITSNNEIHMVARLLDGTAIDYIKDKHLKHIKTVITDGDSNIYPNSTKLIGEQIFEDINGVRVFKSYTVQYISVDDFNTYATKKTIRLPEFSGVVDFNEKLEIIRLNERLPLIQLKAVFVTQDPELIQNPVSQVIIIKNMSDYTYNKNMIEDFNGIVLYDSYVVLEFLADYDTPYITEYKWLEHSTSTVFEDEYSKYNTDENFILSLKEDRYSINEDNNIYILNDNEKLDITTRNIYVNENGVELFYKEELIKQYPSSSFMDYTYKIKIESVNRDVTDYLIDWVVGDYMDLLGDNTSNEPVPLCTNSDDKKIYLNMTTSGKTYNIPSPNTYDKIYKITDDYTFSYGDTGLGGYIDSVLNLGLVIIDFRKNLDFTQYIFTLKDVSKKMVVEDNMFNDITNINISYEPSKIYVGIPEDITEPLNLSRYNKVENTEVKWFYNESVISKKYIKNLEETKIRKLLVDDNKFYYDVPEYDRKEVYTQTLTIETSPIFLGYSDKMEPADSALLLSINGNYFENRTPKEVEVYDYQDSENCGYWFDSENRVIMTDIEKEFVYFYDRNFQVPVNYNFSDYTDNELYIQINDIREMVHYDYNNNTYFYLGTGNGQKVTLSILDEESIFLYIEIADGSYNIVPKVIKTIITQDTKYYIKSGGKRIWKQTSRNEDVHYYYETEADNTSHQVMLNSHNLKDIYTMGGIGIVDTIKKYLLVTPDRMDFFYFSKNVWDYNSGEHFRVFLTPAEKSTIQNGTARVSIQDVDSGAWSEMIVNVVLPKYYVDDSNRLVYLKENDYISIDDSYDGNEYLMVRQTTAVPTEDYIKIIETVQREVLAYGTNTHYIDRDETVIMLEEDRYNEIYLKDSKYYINIPEVNHLRIYQDISNIYLYFYIDAVTNERKYIDKWNFENYSKSFLSNATKFIDIPFKKTYETFKETRVLFSYVNSDNETIWLDTSGRHYISSSTNSYVYETGDKRLYDTGYDDLGRYYYDESNKKIYYTEYSEFYFKNNVWYTKEIINDKIYLAREDAINFRINELNNLGFTRFNSTISHNI